MMRRLFSLGARVFVALVMIGLIQQELVSDPTPTAPGPKFVSPNADAAQTAQPSDELTFQAMLNMAMQSARDMLGATPEPKSSQSSLDQLQARNRTPSTTRQY